MHEAIWPYFGLREPVSAATHFVAFLWSIYATALLWRLCRRNAAKQLTTACFGLSMVLLYGASTAYHALQPGPSGLRVLLLLDQTAIFALIAGTYTPALYVLLENRRGKWFVLGGIWGLSIIGIACKWLLPREPYWLTIAFYFSVGWLGLMSVLQLRRVVRWRGLFWAFAGGIAYTLGGVIDLVEWPAFYPGIFAHHELFHLFAMAGTFCHFVFMMQFVVPFRPQPGSELPAAESRTGVILDPAEAALPS